MLTCEQWGFWSDTGYCNKAYDADYERQGLMVDQEQRKELVWQMQAQIAQDRPYIAMINRDVLEAHSGGWDGFVMSPIGSFTAYSKLNRSRSTRSAEPGATSAAEERCAGPITSSSARRSP